jgi:hypothetical protein
MRFEDGPQLPLTSRKKVLIGAGAAMFGALLCAAIALVPATTGPAHADAVVLAIIWAMSIAWSAATVLLLVRQADLPDVATASFVVTISAFAIFASAAAWSVRNTTSEVNMTDALFMGVTAGGLTALLVWGLAMGIARLLRLPVSAPLRDAE